MKLTKAALKKHLKQLNHDQLSELLLECFSVHKDVEKFLSVKLLGSDAAIELFPEYRKKVENEFFPERGNPKLRLKEAKKAISDFEKLTGDRLLALELRFVYVENGIQFTRNYGDIGGSFDNSIVSVFGDIVREINEIGSEELFKEEYEERIKQILSRATGTSWGLEEGLHDWSGHLGWMDWDEAQES